jgi:cytosine deaminase
MVTRNPLAGAGRDWAIEPGKPANLILLDCPDEVEAIRLRPAVRTVIRRGRVVAETEPGRTQVYADEGQGGTATTL